METIRTYKLLRQNDHGILFPLFIDTKKSIPIGEWIEARAPTDEAIKDVPEGYALIDLKEQNVIAYTIEKPHPSQVSYQSHLGRRWIQKQGRKVYDLGLATNGQVLRFAHRPGWHSSATPSLPAVDMTGKVWAECLIPADDYYTLHRNVSGLSRTHEPIDWYISSKLLIVKTVPQPTTPT